MSRFGASAVGSAAASSLNYYVREVAVKEGGAAQYAVSLRGGFYPSRSPLDDTSDQVESLLRVSSLWVHQRVKPVRGRPCA